LYDRGRTRAEFRTIDIRWGDVTTLPTSDLSPWAVPRADLLETLFNELPDVVFFLKDRGGRYTAANQTLLDRCGIAHRESLLGRTAEEVFPSPLGTGYTAQDRQVLRTGAAIRDKLELHLYPGGGQGWCLTCKLPVLDETGAVTGLAGLSRDLHRPDESHPEYHRLARAVERLFEGFGEPLRLEAVAAGAGLSLDAFERLVKQVFHLTPRQLLTQTRIEAAARLLREGSDSVAEIAYACGYSDHSAFTRQFRSTVGMTPREYRQGVGG
jgi:AraC-like DNA-binding protein